MWEIDFPLIFFFFLKLYSTKISSTKILEGKLVLIFFLIFKVITFFVVVSSPNDFLFCIFKRV